MKLDAISYSTGEAVTLELSGGAISAVTPRPGRGTDGLPYVAPGFVDLQINGYAGHDLNRTPLSEQTVSEVVRAAFAEGVTSFLPTVITNADASIAQAMSAIASACAADDVAAACVAGIHLEGPFIAAEDGPRGAHAREHVRPPDWDLFRRWQDAAGGRIRVLTMSPEWPGSAAFIERCAASGVVVSIGHTAATPEQIADAVRAGARLSTHLGNGAHLMLPRHPNYLWEQLAQDALWTCVIADGFHLPDQVLKVVLKVKGDRAIVVSDAVSLAGMPAGTYATPVGGDVVLTPEGRLHLAKDARLLAGSAQMLPHHVSHLLSHGLASLRDAWEMASVRPARLLGLPQQSGLSVGAPADLAVFRLAGQRVRIEQTFKAGKRVFGAD